MPRVTNARGLALIAVMALLTGGCRGSGTTALEGCAPASLATRTKGTLTLSTGVITRSPWVSGPTQEGRSADPRNGKGYDAAVGFALAERLGFDASQVKWVASPFADTLAAGAKPWDVNVNQVTIRGDRAKDVDLSRPYYTSRQAVVTLKGRPAAGSTSVADLRSVTFAVVAGTAAQTALTQTVHPTTPALTYPDLDKVRGAVSSGAQQALVTDFVTALRLDSQETELVDGTLVGVLPRMKDGSAERFGLVLQKNSPLTPCVNKALDAMDDDGSLERLERKWLVEAQGWKWLH